MPVLGHAIVSIVVHFINCSLQYGINCVRCMYVDAQKGRWCYLRLQWCKCLKMIDIIFEVVKGLEYQRVILIW